MYLVLRTKESVTSVKVVVLVALKQGVTVRVTFRIMALRF